MKLKCFLKGHKHTRYDEWNYNETCDVCDMHAYYDTCANPEIKFHQSYDFTLPGILTGWRLRIKYFVIEPYFRKCSECGKWSKLFGRHTGKHDQCLPF